MESALRTRTAGRCLGRPPLPWTSSLPATTEIDDGTGSSAWERITRSSPSHSWTDSPAMCVGGPRSKSASTFQRPMIGPIWSALGGRSSLRHQDLREGSASEALLFDHIELQMLVQVGERAVARADRNRDRQLVFVDEAQAGQ